MGLGEPLWLLAALSFVVGLTIGLLVGHYLGVWAGLYRELAGDPALCPECQDEHIAARWKRRVRHD